MGGEQREAGMVIDGAEHRPEWHRNPTRGWYVCSVCDGDGFHEPWPCRAVVVEALKAGWRRYIGRVMEVGRTGLGQLDHLKTCLAAERAEAQEQRDALRAEVDRLQRLLAENNGEMDRLRAELEQIKAVAREVYLDCIQPGRWFKDNTSHLRGEHLDALKAELKRVRGQQEGGDEHVPEVR